MNASSCTTFFTYMLEQTVIPFSKELFGAFIMAPNIRKTLTILLELQTFIYNELGRELLEPIIVFNLYTKSP